MDVEVVSEQAAVPALPRIAPATFRGVDCAVLAERYVAYRRERGLDVVIPDLDVITPASSASSAEA